MENTIAKITADDIIKNLSSIPLFEDSSCIEDLLESLDDLFELYVCDSSDWVTQHKCSTWNLYRGVRGLLIDLRQFQNQKGGNNE